MLSQAGFGWTNGVALWIASNYGKVVVTPHCPSLLDVPGGPQPGGGSKTGEASPTGRGITGRAWKHLPDAAALAIIGAIVHFVL